MMVPHTDRVESKLQGVSDGICRKGSSSTRPRRCYLVLCFEKRAARRRRLELERVAEIEYVVASWLCFESFEKWAARRRRLVAEIEYVVALWLSLISCIT